MHCIACVVARHLTMDESERAGTIFEGRLGESLKSEVVSMLQSCARVVMVWVVAVAMSTGCSSDSGSNGEGGGAMACERACAHLVSQCVGGSIAQECVDRCKGEAVLATSL